MSTKPTTLIRAELALVAAWRSYDALEQRGVPADQRIKAGERYCRAHPEDRDAGVTLSKLRAQEATRGAGVEKALAAYEREPGAVGASWPWEAETQSYLGARRAGGVNA